MVLQGGQNGPAFEGGSEFLRAVGFSDEKGDLTNLGQHLAKLPLKANIGKILLVGSVFRCLDPALSLAALLSCGSPFAPSEGEGAEALARKREFADNSYSDHLAVLKAYEAWVEAKDKGTQATFCEQNSLSREILEFFYLRRFEYLEQLSRLGFVDTSNLKAFNLYSTDRVMVRIILCAGLYPNIVLARRTGKQTSFYAGEREIGIHPSSVNAGISQIRLPYMLYTQMANTASNAVLQDSTSISVHPLLLFAGDLCCGDFGVEFCGGSLSASPSGRVLDLIKKVRMELDELLSKMLHNPVPGLDILTEGQQLGEAVFELRRYLACHQFRHEFKNGIRIFQPHIIQNPHACSFASISKQMDYQLRMTYALAYPPTSLAEDVCLINYVEDWQNELRARVGRDPRWLWQPQELLEEAKSIGAPLWSNGNRHKIQEIISVYEVDRTAIESFLSFGFAVGVVEVTEDFVGSGAEVYEGYLNRVETMVVHREKNVEEKVGAYHATLLLDFCDVEGELYVAYQNSYDDNIEYMCGEGVSWTRAELIAELHYGATLPPVNPSTPLQSVMQVNSLHHDVKCVLENVEVVETCSAEARRKIDEMSSHLKGGRFTDFVRVRREASSYCNEIGNNQPAMESFVAKYGGLEAAFTLVGEVEAAVSRTKNALETGSECMAHLEETMKALRST